MACIMARATARTNMNLPPSVNEDDGFGKQRCHSLIAVRVFKAGAVAAAGYYLPWSWAVTFIGPRLEALTSAFLCSTLIMYSTLTSCVRRKRHPV